MSHKARAIFLFLTIVAVMFASAVGTTNVYADDGTPPPPPTEAPAVDPSTGEAEPVATEEPVEEAAATEAVVTEPEVVEPVATEPAVVEEAAPVVEEQQPAEEAAEVETILEQVPEDTTVVVLNAEGEAQSLTTQESADAILTGDPIWCPDYQDPTPGANGCTQSFNSFDALLSYLKAHEGEDAYKQDGKIYVQMGTYVAAPGETSINFTGFSSLNQYNLTIQGGWDTSGTDIVADNPTKLNVPIVVGTEANPWVGSLSFDGIKITNANGTGLTLYSAQDISLTNVEVTDSTGGAALDAGGMVFVADSKFNHNKKFGAKIDADGDVYVVNSEFDKNGYGQGDTFGLTISNRGSEVVLDNISASTNDYGADVNSTSIVTVRNSFFSGNIAEDCDYLKLKTCHCTVTGGYGLHVVTTGVSTNTNFAAVNLTDVTANDNYLYGAHIEAADARIYNSTFIADKKTQGYGLEVLTTGGTGVKLDNVRASNNEQFGANITAGAFVEVKNSFFDGNASYKQTCGYGAKEKGCYQCTTEYFGYGLQVVTTDGIALSKVSAQDNNLFGARLDGLSVGVSNSIFSGNGSFTGDDPNQPLTGKGLEVISDSNVTLSSVEANNNELFGANIQAQDWVAITHSFFNGHKVYSYSGDCTDADKGKTCNPCVKTATGGYGLEVITDGTISLTAVQANDNYLFGTHLKGSSVSISNGELPRSTFNKNGKEGLKIETTGTVLLDGIEANGNSLAGAVISAGAKVTILRSFFSGNFSYTSSYCKGKTYYGFGLQVVTAGDISMSNVTADDNYLYGASLTGKTMLISDSSFSSNGTGILSDHIGSGLTIKSTGTNSIVDLAGVTANGNQLYGANITAEGNVSVAYSFFSGNQSYYKDCGGTKSSGGSSSGGSSSGGSNGGKTCQNCKTVYDGYGLQIVTTGNISLNHVEAEKNYLYGARLDGNTVNVGYSTFNENASPTVQGQTPTGRGLEVISDGNTSLWDVKANNNQLFGADVQAGGNVTINSSFFNNNKYTVSTSCKGNTTAGYGLKVTATGTIFLGPDEDPEPVNNEASGNGAEGAILNGQTTVEVVDSLFNNNGANGLTVTANDTVTLNNVEATGNKGNGAEVTSACTKIVHVDGGKYASNSKYGLKVVKGTYEQGSTAPTFTGNGSGGLFQDTSTCVTSGGGSGSGGGSNGGGNSGGGNSGGGNGWNWYWWWYWHHGFGHH